MKRNLIARLDQVALIEGDDQKFLKMKILIEKYCPTAKVIRFSNFHNFSKHLFSKKFDVIMCDVTSEGFYERDSVDAIRLVQPGCELILTSDDSNKLKALKLVLQGVDNYLVTNRLDPSVIKKVMYQALSYYNSISYLKRLYHV